MRKSGLKIPVALSNDCCGMLNPENLSSTSNGPSPLTNSRAGRLQSTGAPSMAMAYRSRFGICLPPESLIVLTNGLCVTDRQGCGCGGGGSWSNALYGEPIARVRNRKRVWAIHIPYFSRVFALTVQRHPASTS
eukprot:2272187-Prymnesium_polylepis.3